MPVDAAHHRLLHGRSSPFMGHRYTPLSPLQEYPSFPPISSPDSITAPVHSPEAKVVSRYGHLPGRTRPPTRPPRKAHINRPCMKHKFEQPVAPPRTRYSKLNISNNYSNYGRGGANLLRAVANKGRGYEDMRCRGPGGATSPDSGSSSTASSPRDSPAPSPRGRSNGILITSAIARSGIKRISRVSFGSSKGSMVETLIYDSPVTEEDRIPEETTIKDPVAHKFGTETGAPQKPASRVRVTFYECEKPLIVTSPEPPDLLDPFLPDFPAMASPGSDVTTPAFDRQFSSESGRDNPFRPDGDISKEADEIVQLIKSGQPLDHASRKSADVTDTAPPVVNDSTSEPLLTPTKTTQSQASPTKEKSPPPKSPSHTDTPIKHGANGSAAPKTEASSSLGTVEVKHATLTPTEATHVEHIVIKKKSKCFCCVIQ